eukprot:371026-Pyramimonas_sp.AAC.1
MSDVTLTTTSLIGSENSVERVGQCSEEHTTYREARCRVMRCRKLRVAFNVAGRWWGHTHNNAGHTVRMGKRLLAGPSDCVSMSWGSRCSDEKREHRLWL